jgi:hypothetical protein
MPRVIFILVAVLAAPFSWGADFFSNPNKSCKSLSQVGISTGGWKPSKAFPGAWLCLSQMQPFGRVGPNGMENNIAFYINGTNRAYTNDIRLKININNPREKAQAFSKLTKATEQLFKYHSAPIPKELSKALKSNTPGSWQTPWGKAELILEGGRIESFKVVLINKEHLQKKGKLLAESASDFERCKDVVAKAVGYSASLINGDGEPVQESGYKSFMLKGKGKDLFFCEVHKSNKYKIKAALNGKFPFRYIAQGSL